MLAGVATGVRNDAAQATQRLTSTGLAETCSCAAADTAMGIMISAVAVLLTSWPNTIVSRTIAVSSAYGPAAPTACTIRWPTASPAPDTRIAVDRGMIPPTSTTVVHDTPR